MGIETFADYILSEKDWIKKMEIVFICKKEQEYSMIIQLFLKHF